MKKIRSFISVLLAVAITLSPVCTNVAFAADQDEISIVTESEAEVTVEVEQEIETPEDADEVTEAPVDEEQIIEEIVEESDDEAIGGRLSDVNSHDNDSTYAGFTNNISNSYENVTPDNLTVILRGLSDANKQNTFDAINQYISAVINDGSSVTLKSPDYIDVEKYNAAGYDTQHCWAATATNILWTTGYAQKAINPITKKAFATPDELFTYFSENFTDVPGRPSDAVGWFFDGPSQYNPDNVEDIAELRRDDTVGLLPGMDHTANTISVVGGDVGAMQEILDVAGQGIGMLVKWLKKNNEGKYYLSGGHWATITGAIIDDTKESIFDKVKAVVVADSDNTPVNGALPATMDEKLTAKSGQPNIYTVYKLTFDTTLKAWVLGGYYSGTAIITHLFTLVDSDKKPEGLGGDGTPMADTINATSEINSEHMGNPDTNSIPVDVLDLIKALNNGVCTADGSEQEIYLIVEQSAANNTNEEEIIKAFTEEDLNKPENIELLHSYMVKKLMPVFLLNNGNVDVNKDYAIYANAPCTMLTSVSIDGTVVPAESYDIVAVHTSMSKIVIKQNYLANLTKGAHTIQMNVAGSDVPTVCTINVK